MANQITNTYSTLLESVRPQFEKLFEQSDQISARVQKSTDVKKVSRWFYRFPLKKTQAGIYAKVDIDGGAAPAATGPVFTHGKGAYYTSVLGFRLSTEQEEQNMDTATVNVLSDILSNVAIELAVMDDIAFHGDGSGILTADSSASNGSTTLTFASATDYLGVNNLRVGMAVDVWDTLKTTKRAPSSGSAITTISDVNYDTKVVTLSQSIASLTATDCLTFYGMDVASTYPLSFQSTFPTSGSGGVTGDSFRHGFRYMTDTDSTRYFYSILKSSLSQIQAVRVNASSTPFEWDFAHRMIAKITNKRDGDQWQKLFGIANMAQRTAVMNLGVSTSTTLLTADRFGKSKDLVPMNMAYQDAFDIAGIPCVVSKRQDRSRIDFINTEKIVRTELFTAKYLENGAGGYLHQGRTSTGAVAFYKDVYMMQAYDYTCVDAGTFGVIDNLSLPDGWDA